MIDSFIFDMDGTLVDNIDTLVNAWKQISQKHHWHLEINKEKFKSFMGLNPHDIGVKLFPNIDENRATKRVLIATVEEIPYLQEKIGKSYIDKETLEILSKKYKLFIVSNCMERYIECYLDNYNFNKYFIETVNASNGRSKGQNIKYIVEKYNLQHPVYIGDTIMDKRSADEAKVRFIFASYGFGNVENVEKINDIKELLNI